MAHWQNVRRQAFAEQDEDDSTTNSPRKHDEGEQQGDGGRGFKALGLAIAFANAQKRKARERVQKSNVAQAGANELRGELMRTMSPESEEDYAPRSLFFLSLENPVRKLAIHITGHRYYEWFTLVLIMCSCTTLAMDSTRQDFSSTPMGRVLQNLEYAWAGLMCAEILMRIVARGLILPRSAFLRSGWGLLDVLVVALGFLNLMPGANNYSAVRAFRVLRPLRAVSRLPKLKVLVVTLLTALPMLLHVVILCTIVYFAFGIVGVEVFMGTYRYRCGVPDMSGAYPGAVDGQAALLNVTYLVSDEEASYVCRGPKLKDPGWLVLPGSSPNTSLTVPSVYDTAQGRQCAEGLYCVSYMNPFYGFINFDHIVYAWLTIFQIISMEGWTDIMYMGQDAVDYWVWPYFVSMIVLGSLFMMNLALVVLYVQFTKSEAAVRNQMEVAKLGPDASAHDGSTSSGEDEEEDELDRMHRLEEEQLKNKQEGEAGPHNSQGSAVFKQMYEGAAEQASETMHRMQRVAHDMARSQWLHNLTVVCIVINTLTMGINWYGIPHTLEYSLSLVNAGLTVYFAVEIVIKIVGIGWRRFFRDGMNTFELFVVIASIIEVIADLVPSLSGVGPLSVLRTLRLLRLMRLITRFPELRRVIHTLFKSVISVAWMSLLTLLFLVVAALLGMQIFGYKFMFCDYAPGAAPLCPLGQRVWGECPDHFMCYVPCQPSQAGTWLQVNGSQFFDNAYCQRFCSDGSYTGDGQPLNASVPAGVQCEYVAAVGQSIISPSTFDNFGVSLLTVFQLITGENWNNVMYDGMRTVGQAAALYFIFVIVVGNYVVLNLFIAILLENFAANMGDGVEEVDSDDEDWGAVERTASFVKEEARADRLWYTSMFGKHTQVYPEPTGASERSMHGGKNYHAREYQQQVEKAKKEGEAPGAEADASAEAYFQKQLARTDTELEQRLNQEEFMKGQSLFLFGPDSKFRWKCLRMVTWKWFDALILTLIGISSVCLAIDSPALEDQHPEVTNVLRYMDLVFSAVFIFEAVLKIISLGFVFNGKTSYLRDWWNVLDFLIVLSSIAMIVIQATSSSGQNLQMLRALRTLRVLRPLRVASTSEQLRVVIMALFSSLRSLLYVGVVCALFYLLFGILGVNLLKGELRYCTDATDVDQPLLSAFNLLPAGYYINKTWCEAGLHEVNTSWYHTPLNVSFPAPAIVSTEWINPVFPNFDNLGSSVLTLFGVATTELWVNTMNSAMAAVDPEQQPRADYNPAMSLYFVAFLVVGSFLVLNLLVAITIEKFSELQSRHLGYNLFLTPQQQQWVDVQRVLGDTHPERVLSLIPGLPPWRQRVFNLIASRPFMVVMHVVVLLNILFMTLTHADMGEDWEEMKFWADVTFTLLFAIEATLQIIGLGFRQYFTDSWFQLLFMIVLMSICFIALDAVGIGSYALASLLRVLRVTRFLRIITAIEGLNQLVRTLWLALPAIGNVGSVMLLFFFIWAVLGMNLFATVKFGQYLTRQNNFENWPNSMMALFRQVTGESWDGVMSDCMITKECMLITANVTLPSTNETLLAGSWFDLGASILNEVPTEAVDNKCTPNVFVTVLFFVSFELLCAYIILNIVVAIILEGMINDEADEMLPVPPSMTQQYVEVWSELDPMATGYIQAHDLPILIMELEPPLGNRGCASMRAGAQDIIMTTDIPNRKNKFHFMEVLHALAGRIAGAELPDMTEDKTYARLTRHLPKEPPHPIYNAAHFHAAMYVAASIKGFLYRYEHRAELAEFYAQLNEMEAEEVFYRRFTDSTGRGTGTGSGDGPASYPAALPPHKPLSGELRVARSSNPGAAAAGAANGAAVTAADLLGGVGGRDVMDEGRTSGPQNFIQATMARLGVGIKKNRVQPAHSNDGAPPKKQSSSDMATASSGGVVTAAEAPPPRHQGSGALNGGQQQQQQRPESGKHKAHREHRERERERSRGGNEPRSGGNSRRAFAGGGLLMGSDHEAHLAGSGPSVGASLSLASVAHLEAALQRAGSNHQEALAKVLRRGAEGNVRPMSALGRAQQHANGVGAGAGAGAGIGAGAGVDGGGGGGGGGAGNGGGANGRAVSHLAPAPVAAEALQDGGAWHMTSVHSLHAGPSSSASGMRSGGGGGGGEDSEPTTPRYPRPVAEGSAPGGVPMPPASVSRSSSSAVDAFDPLQGMMRTDLAPTPTSGGAGPAIAPVLTPRALLDGAGAGNGAGGGGGASRPGSAVRAGSGGSPLAGASGLGSRLMGALTPPPAAVMSPTSAPASATPGASVVPVAGVKASAQLAELVSVRASSDYGGAEGGPSPL